MRFEVDRASGDTGDGPPCEGAFRAAYTVIDRRTADHPAKIPANAGMTEAEAEAWWKSQGSNHRVVNGMIEREMGEAEMWCVEIGTLEELMVLREREGHALLIGDAADRHSPRITIVDDYL